MRKFAACLAGRSTQLLAVTSCAVICVMSLIRFRLSLEQKAGFVAHLHRKSACPLDHRSAGAKVNCYCFGQSAESFSTECLSLSTMLAVIGQIEVMRCFTARTWVPKKAGRG
jgi:hypothetical protein